MGKRHHEGDEALSQLLSEFPNCPVGLWPLLKEWGGGGGGGGREREEEEEFGYHWIYLTSIYNNKEDF